MWSESDEPEINNIGNKFQDNNNSPIRNDLTNARWNQIKDII